jgi:hypothetical protein
MVSNLEFLDEVLMAVGGWKSDGMVNHYTENNEN